MEKFFCGMRSTLHAGGAEVAAAADGGAGEFPRFLHYQITPVATLCSFDKEVIH